MAESAPLAARAWKQAYKDATSFPQVGAALALKIFEAEEAVLARRRELSKASGLDVEEEREALEDALYVLVALGLANNTFSRPA